MDHVLTLIAPAGGPALDQTHLRAASDALKALRAAVGTPRWLKPGEAADLPFAGIAPGEAAAAARAALDAAPIDLAAQPAAGRRKRLLVADMDSTIVTGETLDELADCAGLRDRIAAITARAMNGELDFAAALRERVAMLEGLPAEALERTYRRIAITPGAAALVATMRAHGAVCALVSGGFRFFTARVRDRLGFHLDRANDLIVEDGRLTGRVAEPILDRDAKLATLRGLAAERALPLSAALAVGDGANDLPMLQAAGLGVAFRAKPSVAAAARVRIDHADLTALLWLQGYAEEEIAGADAPAPRSR
ncbi:phosphoserine phosphatase SerB [Elioraea sp.]|uniref:phosphoserine phosphatase SerB n=1 Tax=Elioraea sp. TaxID=2185103 RepID=UPI0021DD372F|nr:phosphoserine phosphatase SerB [Elioraea sp.]GIX10461.1 MAG: phosphoserine phosphatase SerB [Elioraea sp.]